MFKIGRVTHYYDKIGVALIELTDNLTVGEKIKFVRGGEELFTQKVDSIQMEHRKLDSAKMGDVVGLATAQPVREGTEIFKSEV